MKEGPIVDLASGTAAGVAQLLVGERSRRQIGPCSAAVALRSQICMGAHPTAVTQLPAFAMNTHAGHPFDTVKVVMQVRRLWGASGSSRGASPAPFCGPRLCTRPGAALSVQVPSPGPLLQTSATQTSVLGAARAVVGARGPLGFYRGMAAPLATVAAYNAIVFGTWGAVERVLSPGGGFAWCGRRGRECCMEWAPERAVLAQGAKTQVHHARCHGSPSRTRIPLHRGSTVVASARSILAQSPVPFPFCPHLQAVRSHQRRPSLPAAWQACQSPCWPAPQSCSSAGCTRRAACGHRQGRSTLQQTCGRGGRCSTARCRSCAACWPTRAACWACIEGLVPRC